MNAEQRISRLELRVNALLVALFACIGLVVFMAAHGKEKRVIEAEAFHLLDADGNKRAALIMTAEGPMLGFLDDEGHQRVLLGIVKSHDTGGLTLLDFTNGKSRNRAVLTAGRKTGLVMWSDDGKVAFTTDRLPN